MAEFKYEPTFQYGADDTAYRLLTRDGFSTAEFGGRRRSSTSRSSCVRRISNSFAKS
jgi:fumarate hydratase class I